jgi:hypothetical protein
MKNVKNVIKKIRYKVIYTFVLISLQGKGICLTHSKVMAQQIAYFKVYG